MIVKGKSHFNNGYHAAGTPMYVHTKKEEVTMTSVDTNPVIVPALTDATVDRPALCIFSCRRNPRYGPPTTVHKAAITLTALKT